MTLTVVSKSEHVANRNKRGGSAIDHGKTRIRQLQRELPVVDTAVIGSDTHELVGGSGGFKTSGHALLGVLLRLMDIKEEKACRGSWICEKRSEAIPQHAVIVLAGSKNVAWILRLESVF